MVKSTDSFFIRFGGTAGTAFSQTTQDLGAFVDALGQSVLRIHNVSVQYTDTNGVATGFTVNDDTVGVAGWQITTQSQTALVTQREREVVSCGSIIGAYHKGGAGAAAGLDLLTEDASLNPQDFTNGYLIAVESLYFGLERNGNWASGDIFCDVVMECTVERLSKEAALALALSQQ